MGAPSLGDNPRVSDAPPPRPVRARRVPLPRSRARGRRSGHRVLLPLVRHACTRRRLPALVAERPRSAVRHRVGLLPGRRGVLVVRPAGARVAQMQRDQAAGIDEIAVSWWGRGSAEDGRLPAVAAAARADGIVVAVHLEPYTGRSVAGDRRRRRVSARRPTASRRSTSTAPPTSRSRDWAAASLRCTPAERELLRADRARRLGGRGRSSTASTPTTSSRMAADKFARICNEAHALHLLCAPSVGPGLPRAPRRRRSTREAAAATGAPTTRCGVPRSPPVPTA